MAVWQKENRYDKAVKVVLFLISPFFSLLYSLRTLKTKSSYVVFFLFAVFFGLAFTTQPHHTMDSVRYIEKFNGYIFYSLNDFLYEFQNFLTFSEGDKDFYFNTVAFIVSRFTDNYHVLFAVFAAVFSYFSLKSFKFLTSSDNFKTSLFCLILAFMFMRNDIFNINGVRFWTAAWIATYATFQIYVNKNKKYLLLAIIVPFVHIAYWVYLGLLIIVYFTARYKKVWIILFIVSFFTSSFIFELIGSVQQYLPPVISKMVDSYTAAEYVSERSEVNSVIMHTFSILGGLFRNLVIFLFIKNMKYIDQDKRTDTLFGFLLILATFVNYTMIVPSLGGRFAALMYPFIAHIWIITFGVKRYRYLIYIFPLVSFSSIYLSYHYYMSVLPLSFFFSSPIVIIWKNLIVA